MHTKLILEFLRALAQNNTLEWMHMNKAYYEQAKGEMEELLGVVMREIHGFDPSVSGLAPKDLIFRLNRDTRFSRDKSPYNPAFRAHISPAGRAPIPPGYYLKLQPGKSFLGGGLFAAVFSDATRMVRDAIIADRAAFEAVLNVPEFAETFRVAGDTLKNVPKPYDKAHPHAEYLKHKSWYVEEPLSDALIEDSAALIEHCVQSFQKMKPLNDFLGHALRDFTMPKRP